MSRFSTKVWLRLRFPTKFWRKFATPHQILAQIEIPHQILAQTELPHQILAQIARFPTKFSRLACQLHKSVSSGIRLVVAVVGHICVTNAQVG